jgi:hypothetical protein
MAAGPRERSLFGPIVLIGAGVIWLLANFDVIPDLNLGGLLRLWPLFLIAAGLELLFGRGRPLVGGLIGLLTVGAAVGLLFFGPQLGLVRNADLKTERFTAPRDQAAAANIVLDLASYPTEVRTLSDSALLFDGELTFTGEVDFDVSGTTQKTVSLSYREDFTGPWDWFSDFDARWRIGLSPAVPLDLNVDVGSGSADLDLAALQLAELTIRGGSGSLDLILPPAPAGEAYEGQLDGDSGSIDLTLTEETNATLRYDGGSGSLTVDVPAGLAVRVEVEDSGSGSVRFPANWDEQRRGDNDEGTWQTPGFDQAARRFVLIIDDLGSGSVTVR